MNVIKKIRERKVNLIALSVLLIIVIILGAFLGNKVATSHGTVTLSEVSFYGSKDNVVSAFLFQPISATPQNKVPAVMLAYGGTGLKDFMVNIAIELGRRGFVALAVDTTGCGFTEGTSSNVALDALSYLRGLGYVDTDNIGLVSQSMGRNFIQAAIDAEPDWYKSCMFLGITPSGGPDYVAGLKNAGVVYGIAEESSELDAESWTDDPWWSESLLNGTGHEGAPQASVVYGDISEGTGRIVYRPNIDHAQTTESTQSASAVNEWMTLTLGSNSALAHDNTVMQWKQFWVSISFLAMIAFIFTAATGFAKSEYFTDVIAPLPEYKGFKGRGFWICAGITTLLGPLLYVGSWTKWPLVRGLNSRLPFEFANHYATWFLVLAAVTAALLIINYFILRKDGFTFKDTGLVGSPKKIIKSLVGAMFIFLVIYTVAVLCYGKYKMPITLSGIPIPIMFRPLDSLRMHYFLNYFAVYLPFYLTIGVLFAGFMRPGKGSIRLGKEMLINSAILSVGSILFLLLFYVPLYAGHGTNQALIQWGSIMGSFAPGFTGIIMIYLIPVPIFNTLTACTLTYFNRKTGNVWLGAIIMALLFTWMQVSTMNFGGAIAF